MNINETFDKTKKEPVLMSVNLKVKEPKENVYTLTGTVKADKCNVDILSDIVAKIIKDCTPEDLVEDVLDETAKKLGFIDENKVDESDCESCDNPLHIETKVINKEKLKAFENFLKKLLGE